MPLAEDHVGKHVLAGDRAAALRVEFVAVRALEHDALAVDRHDAVFDAERAEADLLRHGFDDGAVVGERVEQIDPLPEDTDFTMAATPAHQLQPFAAADHVGGEQLHTYRPAH